MVKWRLHTHLELLRAIPTRIDVTPNGGEHNERAALERAKKSQPDHKIRVICVRINPHTTRGRVGSGSSGVDSDGILRIATNLLDVPAETISLIFEKRWAIETFFDFSSISWGIVIC